MIPMPLDSDSPTHRTTITQLDFNKAMEFLEEVRKRRTEYAQKVTKVREKHTTADYAGDKIEKKLAKLLVKFEKEMSKLNDDIDKLAQTCKDIELLGILL